MERLSGFRFFWLSVIHQNQFPATLRRGPPEFITILNLSLQPALDKKVIPLHFIFLIKCFQQQALNVFGLRDAFLGTLTH